MAGVRVWRVRDAAACWALVTLTGVGAMSYDQAVDATAWPRGVGWLAVISAGVSGVLATFVMGRRPVSERVAAGALVAVLLLATIEFVSSVGIFAAQSDNASALEVGWRALMRGADPYAQTTRLGAPLTPMLGAFLLAGPMVAAGMVGALGMAWLWAGSAALWRALGPRAALTVAACLTLSPAMRLAWPNEWDYWINAAALVLFGSLSYLFALRPGPAFYAATGLLGFALAYRLPLSIVLLPLAVLMFRTRERRIALRWLLVAGSIAMILVAAPLLDLVHYGPSLRIIVSRGDGTVPLVGFLILVVTTSVLLALSMRVRSLSAVWATGCLVTGLGFALVALAQVPSVGWHAPFASYNGISGMPAVLTFGLIALVLPLEHRSSGSVPRETETERRTTPSP